MNGSKRNYMIYGTMLAVFGLLMWWVVRMGEAYDTSDVVAVRHADSSVDLLRETLASNLTHPVPLLLLQIIAILVAVRIFSYLFKYLGQPGVIGEIVAGIVLGPSVLVLYTMQDIDVAGWVRSLQLRGIELPDDLKDEVFLIIGERRNGER